MREGRVAIVPNSVAGCNDLWRAGPEFDSAYGRCMKPHELSEAERLRRSYGDGCIRLRLNMPEFIRYLARRKIRNSHRTEESALFGRMRER